jgi:hypothetical protein
MTVQLYELILFFNRRFSICSMIGSGEAGAIEITEQELI